MPKKWAGVFVLIVIWMTSPSVLKVNIDKRGNISDAKLISGASGLALASIEAVKQWKYDPYILNGYPVAMETQVTVTFALPE